MVPIFESLRLELKRLCDPGHWEESSIEIQSESVKKNVVKGAMEPVSTLG